MLQFEALIGAGAQKISTILEYDLHSKEDRQKSLCHTISTEDLKIVLEENSASLSIQDQNFSTGMGTRNTLTWLISTRK